MVLACAWGLSVSGVHPAMAVREKIDFYQHGSPGEEE
jgi:nitroimidazol reductase NimA-like FMN-containing flavoprotein (pyridoxamine 5'-phosphate oxidase superfamily)